MATPDEAQQTQIAKPSAEHIKTLLDTGNSVGLGLPACCDNNYISSFTSLAKECGAVGTHAKDAISRQLIVQLLMVVEWFSHNNLLQYQSGCTGIMVLKPLTSDSMVKLYVAAPHDGCRRRVEMQYKPTYVAELFLAYHCQWLSLHPPPMTKVKRARTTCELDADHCAPWPVVARLTPATPFLVPHDMAAAALDHVRGSPEERAALEAILCSQQHVAYVNVSDIQPNASLKSGIAATPVLEILLRSSLRWDHWVC